MIELYSENIALTTLVIVQIYMLYSRIQNIQDCKVFVKQKSYMVLTNSLTENNYFRHLSKTEILTENYSLILHICDIMPTIKTVCEVAPSDM